MTAAPEASYALRLLTGTAADIELGQALVREYVEATAQEMAGPGEGADLDRILPYIPDYHDFAAKYGVPGAFFLVAEWERIAGGGVGVARYDAATCEMNRLWVRPPHRGLGAGRALAVESIERARSLGYRRMLLDVLTSRTGPTALYRSLGFVDCEPIHEYAFPTLALALDL